MFFLDYTIGFPEIQRFSSFFSLQKKKAPPAKKGNAFPSDFQKFRIKMLQTHTGGRNFDLFQDFSSFTRERSEETARSFAFFFKENSVTPPAVLVVFRGTRVLDS